MEFEQKRVNILMPIELWEAARKSNINMSRTAREGIKEALGMYEPLEVLMARKIYHESQAKLLAAEIEKRQEALAEANVKDTSHYWRQPE